ncbi:hypothetical protein GCM10011367_22680 [Marinicauda pacifica]|uniref:Response regulatory domain-containing protein n=1 Tax=Marinicauda pacifica TaxID=1133559 RepID=A0A4S2H8Y8_9PROT|nr:MULTISPECIES: hypothetical protein [Marinicauda]TGY92256.1 hypothetical protein E5162_11430 [Marinicauda pacifica]GGE47362.1 hypothetical protein GCM10011367_22680 [Marinicauda pacifica]
MLTGCTLFLIETDTAVFEAFEALSSTFNFVLHRFDTLQSAMQSAIVNAGDCVVLDCDNPSDVDQLLFWRETQAPASQLLLLSGLPGPLLNIFRGGNPGLEILEKPVNGDELIAVLLQMKKNRTRLG